MGKSVIWGRGLAENVRIPSYGGKESKIAFFQKHGHKTVFKQMVKSYKCC